MSLPSTIRPTFWQAILIIAAGIWVFYPALHGGWLWDDGLLIRDNELVHNPVGFWKIWFAPSNLIDYFPLTVSFEWLEWQLWGANPLCFHVANLVLHLLNGFLVWHLLAKFNLRFAWLGGLLFVIHPVVVESVAWIAEIKNTLSLAPFLLAMCAWTDFERTKASKSYFSALILFLIATLCKTTMVMFPLVILLYSWWKRGRIGWTDLKVSAPFFAISFATGIATLAFFHPLSTNHAAGFAARTVLAGETLVFYFSKCVLPVGLLPIYPQWPVDASQPSQYLPWLITLVLFAACWANRKTWGRHAILGLGFFFLNLAPFLGFNLAPYMDFTWVMDHLLYVPLIGLIGLFVAALEDVTKRIPRGASVGVLSVVAIAAIFLAMGSRAYAGMFGDPLALWTYAAQGNSDSAVVRVSLGETLAQRGRIPEAIDQFKEAIQLDPTSMNPRDDLGKALNQLGQIPEAIAAFQAELQVNSDDVNAAYSLGNIYIRLRQIPEAKKWYEKSIQLNSNYFAAFYALGCIALGENQYPEAIDYLQKAQKLDATHAEVYGALGNAFVKTNQLPEAIVQFQKVVDLRPNDAGARCDLGVAFARSGKMAEATHEFQAALQSDPTYYMAHYDLGSAYLGAGQISPAIDEYRATLQLKPDFVPAQQGLDRALSLKRTDDSKAP